MNFAQMRRIRPGLPDHGLPEHVPQWKLTGETATRFPYAPACPPCNQPTDRAVPNG